MSMSGMEGRFACRLRGLGRVLPSDCSFITFSLWFTIVCMIIIEIIALTLLVKFSLKKFEKFCTWFGFQRFATVTVDSQKPEKWTKVVVPKIREVLPNLIHKLMSWKNRKMLDDPVATCCVCLGPKGEVLRTLIPCGHTYFCTECVDRISNGPDARCPYCREPITSTMRIRM